MQKREKEVVIVFLFMVVLLLFSNTVSAYPSYLNQNSTWDVDLVESFWASIALGDVDNDGDLDLAHIGCTGTTGGTICNGFIGKIYINNGTSFVDNSTWSANITAVHYGSIAFGDIDHDADLDLALTGCNNGGGTVSSCSNSHSFIYTNNGTGFAENSTLKGDITSVWGGSIAFGDIDLDGDLDLALTGAGTSGEGAIAKIYLFNGSGFAENSTWQNKLTGVYQSGIVFGDIDNDGKLDLVLTGDDGSTRETTKVYINNGSVFVENSTWQKNLLVVDLSAVSVGDFNNNKNLDLTLIGHFSDDNHEIYNNTGSIFSLFQQAGGSDQSLAGIFEGSQAFGDYDNDGDLDLFTSGKEQYSTTFLFNGYNFSHRLQDPESKVFNTAFGPSAAWGDFDNDGDLDLVLVGYDKDVNVKNASVYLNSITTKNTKPSAPTNFTSVYRDGKLTLTWTNASDVETPVDGLYYNLRVGAASKSHSIVAGIYGGGDDNGYFGNMMQRKSISLTTPLDVGATVFYAVQTIDTALANGSWSLEQSYTVPQDTTTPTITVNALAESFNSSSPTIIFNATVFDDQNLTNVTLYGNWTGALSINETNSTGIINNTNYIFTKNLKSFGDGIYSWLYAATDSTINNTKNSTVRVFRIDTTAPIVNISSPLNGSIESSTNSITFTYNVTDADIANCSLYIDNALDQTAFRPTVKIAQTFVKSFSNAIYQWNVNCTDYLGFQNGSLLYQVKVDYFRPSGGVADSGASSSASFFNSERAVVKSKAGETSSVSFTKDTAVTDISITTNKDFSFPLTVQEVSPVDSSVAAARKISTTGSVYQYLSISAQTDKNSIEHAQIKFKVPLSWFAINDYDEKSIILRRYADTWESLPTKQVERGLTYAYYEAESAGFSLFAITAEKKAVEEVVVEDNVTTEIVKEENVTEDGGEDLEYIIPEKKVPAWVVAAVIITGLASVVYYRKRFLKRKKR